MLTSFDRWMADLEARHFQDLTFPQVSSALRALSSTYVERRARLAEGVALEGAGKRAAFALFYAPLHFLLVNAIVRELPGARRPHPTIVDLGCGTGAAGAAWAAACESTPQIVGIDRHPWVLREAARTYDAFGLRGRTMRGDVAVTGRIARGESSILAAFVLNEMTESQRPAVIEALLARAAAGDQLLIVEPIARSVAKWWDELRSRVEAHGGRADEWRLRVALPPLVAKLDRAAKLDHRELTGRSLWIGRATRLDGDAGVRQTRRPAT